MTLRIKRETITLKEAPRNAFIRAILNKGNSYFLWLPDGIKMSGFVGPMKKGRLIQVIK